MRFSFSNSSGERARVGLVLLGLFLDCRKGTGADFVMVVVGTDEGQKGGTEETDGDGCIGGGVGWKGWAS